MYRDRFALNFDVRVAIYLYNRGVSLKYLETLVIKGKDLLQ